MGVFAADTGHEQVVFCQDPASGLKAIIGIYSTALGPALGGTRFYPYATEEEALHDVLDLSRGMAYKNALAGLDLGGGKAVIWGNPVTDKSEALLRAYGRFVQSLNGRYFTACDVGTYVQDMDVVAKETQFVTGRSVEHGGAGDSSILTAWGVFQGMRAAAGHVWGTPSLSGRRVGIAGLGKVGKYLTGHLLDDGAHVVTTDVSERALDWAKANHPEVDLVPDLDHLHRLVAPEHLAVVGVGLGEGCLHLANDHDGDLHGRSPCSQARAAPIRSIAGGWVPKTKVNASGGSGSERLRSASCCCSWIIPFGSPVSWRAKVSAFASTARES